MFEARIVLTFSTGVYLPGVMYIHANQYIEPACSKSNPQWMHGTPRDASLRDGDGGSIKCGWQTSNGQGEGPRETGRP